MAAIVSTRINRLQALAPRTSTVTVGLGTVVDYSSVTNTPTLGALAAEGHGHRSGYCRRAVCQQHHGSWRTGANRQGRCCDAGHEPRIACLRNSIAAENIGAERLLQGLFTPTR